MTVSFQGRNLAIDGKTIAMSWPILDARDQGDRILVLLDPDSYLLDPDYKNARKQGATAISSYRCELDPVSGAIRSTEFIR